MNYKEKNKSQERIKMIVETNKWNRKDKMLYVSWEKKKGKKEKRTKWNEWNLKKAKRGRGKKKKQKGIKNYRRLKNLKKKLIILKKK